MKALGSTAAPDQALLNFDLFLGNLPAGVQLFSLFKANPALLELVAAIMGSAPGLAAHLARRTLLLDAVLSPAFYLPLPPVAEMRADLAHQLASVEHEQDILDLARRWANDRRFQVGVQQLKAIVRPAQAGPAYSDIADATISALCDRVEQSFAEQHGGFRGQRLAVLGLGKLGSREMSATSDLDLIFVYDIPPDLEASDGRQPLGADPVLHAAQRQDRDGADGPDQRRRLVRSRHAPAPLRPRRPARQFAGRVRELSCAIGLDVGAHGAHARARDPRAGRRWSSAWPTSSRARSAGRAIRWRWCATSPTCATASPAMRRRKARGTSSTCRGGLFDIDFVAQYLALRHAARRPDLLDPHPAEMLRRAADAGVVDRDRRRAPARRAHAPVRRAGPAASHLERRRGGVRRGERARRPAPSRSPSPKMPTISPSCRRASRLKPPRRVLYTAASSSSRRAMPAGSPARTTEGATHECRGRQEGARISPRRPTAAGKLKLSELRGKPVVLYFYPKDDTPGCTAQACGFRDSLPDFGKLKAQVIGV